jgi:hypothetical protein
MSEIDAAVAHAYQLFREHVERYRQEIVVEPLAWRMRCKELAEEFEWLLFCQQHPLAKPPRRPLPPPPPLVRR